MIKNIIFDFDGVLVDSEIIVAKALSEYLSKMNIKFEKEDFSKFAGNKTVQVISNLCSIFKIKDEELFYNDIMKISENIYANDLKPIKGINKFLHSINCNKFIGSNNIKKRILDGLDKVKIDNFFSEDSIFSFDMVGIPKPEPDIYLKTIEMTGINKKETIIIEDSAIGVQAGVSAGIKVFGLTAGGHWSKNRSSDELFDAGASNVFDSYDKMLELINLS